MKKAYSLLASLLLLCVFTTNAANITVGGTISTNTIWNADTVKITSNIIINNGITLTINAGTYVQFQGHYKLDVKGRLLAEGTASNKIVFTALNASIGWTGIKFNQTPLTNDTSKIEYCIISYGKANTGDYYDKIGGAIFCYNFSKLIIRNNIISNNYSSSYGGAIACWYGSSPKIINNIISNNTASSLGGGIFIYTNSSPDIINNTIVNNSGGSQGGGVIAYNSSCHPKIINSIIRGNSASIYPQLGKSTYPIVEYCNVEGGYSGTGNIDTVPYFVSPSAGVGYTFNGLTADWGLQSTSPCRNAGVSPTGYGVSMLDVVGNFRFDEGIIDIGAMEYIASTQVCGTISSNTTWSGDVLITCDVSVANGITLTIDPGTKVNFLGKYHLNIDGRLMAVGTQDSVIIFKCYNPIEGWYGIDFYNTSSSNDTSKIEYCKIKNGRADGSIAQDMYGGAIYIYNFSKLIIRSNIISNNWSNNYGGAICCRYSSAKIINNVIVNNTANYSYGGGIYIYGGSSDTPWLINNIIANNNSTSYGAGLYENSSAAPIIKNNIFWGNEASFSGTNKQIYPTSIANVEYNDIEGGTYTGTGNINSNPKFKNPSAGAGTTYNGANKDWSLQETSPCIDAGTPSTAGLELPPIDLLGKSRVYSSAVDIGAYEDKSSLAACGTITTNTTWDANTINVNCDVTVASGARLTILPGTKVKFNGNYQLEILGSLYAVGTETDTICFTTDNPTTGWKGIFINNPNEYTNDSTIIHNCRIEYLNYSTSLGGAVYVYYADEVRISNCLIKNNTNSTGYGGGIGLRYTRIIIKNNVIKHNSARYGGGISSYYSWDDKISNNIIENNSAQYYGGGIYMRYSVATVTNNMISNNKTTVNSTYYGYGGGGLYYAGYYVSTISNNIIVNNEACNGGGVNVNLDSKPLFYNNTIANNYANYYGGGLIVGDNADPIFKNNIFYNDSAGSVSGGNEVYIYDVTSDPKFYNCLIKGGSLFFGGTGSQLNYNGVYNDNIDDDPLFSNPSSGAGDSYIGSSANWYIDSLSPCINSGTSDVSGMGLITTDYAGNPRINRGRIDIGAYENQEDIYANCTISSNTTWEADTIKVGCDVTVLNGVTLTIAPGTYVEFQGNYKLDIQGRLLAIGNSVEPIIFTINDTTGFTDMTATNGCWNGIEFNSTANTNDTSKIVYSVIKYGKAKESSTYNSNGGGLYIYNYSKVIIANSIITNNRAYYKGGGIYIESSNPVIKNSIICNNSAEGYSYPYGGGIYLDDAYPKIYNNTIAYNYSTRFGAGIYCNNSSPILKNNILNKNQGYYFSLNYNFINDEIYLTTGSNPAFYNNNIMGGKNKISGNSNITTYQDNIDSDTLSLFISSPDSMGAKYDGLSANWDLYPNSPCINAGTANLAGIIPGGEDYVGNTRIVGDTIDIGHFEIQLSSRFITTQPIAQTACEGGSASFSVVIGVFSNYQWQKDGNNINGETSANLTLTNVTLADTGNYACVFSNAFGSVTSDMVSLTIQTPPYIVQSPISASRCLGDSVTFQVSAQGTQPITYQWQNTSGSLQGSAPMAYYTLGTASSVNSGTSYPAPYGNWYWGAKNQFIILASELTAAGISAGDLQSLAFEVTNANNCPPLDNFTLKVGLTTNNTVTSTWETGLTTVYTNASYQPTVGWNTHVFQSPLTWDGTSNLIIETCFNNSSYVSNGNASISFTTTTFNSTHEYHNDIATVCSSTAGSLYTKRPVVKILSGSGVSNYFINSITLNDATTYKCEATNVCGSQLSTGAVLSIKTPPSVSSLPGTYTLCETNPIPLSVTATGDPTPTYQWYKDSTIMIGHTNIQLNISAAAASDQGDYYCKATNICGEDSTNISSVIVNEEPAITSQSSSSSVCENQSITLSVTASGAQPLTYQWYKNNNAITGATNNTYTISSISTSDAATYKCRATNSCGYDESSGIVLTVKAAPSISSQTGTVNVCSNSAAPFSITATGSTPLTYQWYNSSGSIGTATNNTYTISAASTSDAGNYYCIATNSCGSATSNAIPLMVNSAPSVTVQPQSLVKCESQSAIFNIQSSGSSPITYQWYKGGVSISGATSSSHLISPVSTSDAANYYCKATNSCGTATSTSAALTVNTGVSITSQSSSQTICDGASPNFQINVSGTTPIAYQWYNDQGSISGATSSSISITSADTSDAGNYYCVAINNCSSSTSSNILLTVNESPAVENQPVSKTVCENLSAVYNVTASGTAPLSYQWYDNNGIISGATSSSYIIPQVSSADAGTYYVKVTNSCGNINSNTANLTVKNNVGITSQSSSTTVCEGASPSFSITATGSSPISYQWYKDNSLISGSTNNTLSLTSVDSSDAGSYYVMATNSCNSAQSNGISLTVNESPSILFQPVSQTVCENLSAIFNVTTSGTGPLSYQWYDNNGLISGATSSSYLIAQNSTSTAGSYYVKVSNSCGILNSNTATLTVNTNVAITAQSSSLTKCSGNSASFSVTATGTSPITYQWYLNGNAISGATSSTYSISQADTSYAGDYYCVVTNSCNSAQSLTRTLTINSAPQITQQSTGSTLCSGSNISLSVGANGSGSLAYQWYKNSVAIAGANSSVLPIYQIASADAGTYTCTITNSCGFVTSNNMVLVVNSAPSISSQSSNQIVCENALALFNVNATGTAPMAYQWYNSLGLISGATSSSYSISSADTSDIDIYYCTISNSCDTVTSNNISLTVNQAPSIINQSSGATKCIGSAFSFSVNAIGASPLSYQWYDANGPISGAVNNLYLINSVDTSDNGTYYCVITNSCGSVTSTNKILTVNQAPSFTSQSNSSTKCEGSSMLFTVNANGSTPLSYQWFVDTGMVAGANANSYSISNVLFANAGNYYCVVSNSCGSITSSTKTLSVNTSPTILSQSASDTLCQGQSMVFNINTSGTSPITYQWYKGSTPISGAVNSIYMIASVDTLNAGNYSVTATNGCGNIQSSNVLLTVNKLAQITFQSGDSSRCEGESVQLNVNVSGTGPIAYQWYKSGLQIQGANSNVYSMQSLSPNDAGYYYCNISNICNSTNSTNKVITVHANPQVSLGNDTTFCLGGQTNLSPGFGYNCIWSNGSFNNQISVGQSGNYWVNVLDQYGCHGISDTVNVNVILPFANSNICIAGVDSATQKNVVVWEKTPNVGITSYNIYRESSVTGVWNLIENKPYDSLSVVFDMTSNPIAHADRYSITSLDSCGNESALSQPHKTMHLAVSPAVPSGYNLIWNGYQGFTAASYHIWKADTSMKWTKVDSVNGNIFMWHDTSSTQTPFWYQIEVVRPGGPCNPTKANTNYNTSRSNPASNGLSMPNSLTPDFIATPTQGIAPLVVVFYDQTLGNPSGWYWNFGDGSTSSLQNPAHQYDSIGIYDVTLTVTNVDGANSVTKFGFIDVIPDGVNVLEDYFEVAVFPNPYSGKTTIAYTLNNASDVKMEVYSSLGQLVKVIDEGYVPAGKYNYQFSAIENGFSEGVYFLRMSINGKILTKKLVEIK